MTSSTQLWLVTTPNTKKGPEATLAYLKTQIEGAENGRILKFSIPPLSVGTLDSVMALSDDLNKINTQIEVISENILC